MHDHNALWTLTFDMSGDRKPAQPAGGRPLDGGVRCHDDTAYGFACAEGDHRVNPRTFIAKKPMFASSMA